MEDIASAQLAEELVASADNLREEAQKHLDEDNESAAAELFATAGDKYSAAAEDSTYDFKFEERMRSARLCWRLADQLEATNSADINEIGGNESRIDRRGSQETDEDEGSITEMITEEVGVDLDDYVGREELKDTMDRKVFSHAENPELDEEFGIKPANGFILYGPPGTGKTFFARCMAGEVDMPFVELDFTEMISKYVNESAQLVGEIFEEVREHGPMMICINELDAVAKSRESDMTSSEQKAINKFLTEVEELSDSQTIIVGTTNKPEELDSAVTRSGRFTDKFEIGIPDEELRRDLIQKFMADRPLASSWELDETVAITEGCTPADLDEICNEAALIGRDHYIETGEKGITNTMFEDAYKNILDNPIDI